MRGIWWHSHSYIYLNIVVQISFIRISYTKGGSVDSVGGSDKGGKK